MLLELAPLYGDNVLDRQLLYVARDKTGRRIISALNPLARTVLEDYYGESLLTRSTWLRGLPLGACSPTYGV